MQGLMWRAYDSFGFLQYSFVETVEAMHPYYMIRAVGGLLFLIGALHHGLQRLAHHARRRAVDAADQPRIAAAPELRHAPAE